MDTPLLLPKHLFIKYCGIGIDFGSSAVKVCIAKEEGEHIKFKVERFSSEQLKDALLYIKKEADPEFLNDGGNISSVGVQVNVNGDLFEEILGVRPRKHSYSEGDTLVDGFMFLAKHLKIHEFICGVSEDALAAAAKMSIAWQKVVPAASDEGRVNPWPCMSGELPPEVPLMPNNVEYPLILTLFGSASAVLVVHDSGRYDWVDMHPIAGRTFLGLGSLLCGEKKSFSDLLAMAKNGDMGKVHQLMSDLNSGDNESPFYQRFEGDMLLFAFGNAIQKAAGDVKLDDRIAALLFLIAQGIAADVFKWAVMLNIQHCYFTGGLSTFPYIQELITQEFQFQNLTNFKGFRAAHHFLRHGAFNGAIGALIRDMSSSVLTN